MNSVFASTIFTLALMTIGYSSIAQNQSYDLKHYNLEKSIAIQGYDPVAYFTVGKAIEGSEKIIYMSKGVTYRFSTQANKTLFAAEPKKYEPQYGGYCAYAMADGNKVRVDPETFKVIDGKLFLFYNFRFTNTLKSWNKDEPNLLPKAEKEWAKLITGN